MEYTNKLFSENDLNNIYQNLKEKCQGTCYNVYDAFLEECKLKQESKVDSQGKPLYGIEKHHIIPRYEGGTDTPENIILLTVKEHVLAHWLRYKVFNKKQDYCAFLFRIGNTEEALTIQRENIKAARERDKANKKGFFSSAFQSKMGKRGGTIGGSKNTKTQFQARQQVGLEYGRQTGLKNQSGVLAQFLAKSSIWGYSEKAANDKSYNTLRDDEIFFFISEKEAFIDLLNVLNNLVPNSIKKSETMYKLVRKERKQLYGWRIVDTLTRSEVREGLKRFQKNYPNTILQFEENLMLDEGFE